MSHPRPEGAADPPPAEVLSDVWMLLDELPRGTASPQLTATTLEMAAVTAAGAAASRSAVRAWLLPGGIVAAALVAGLVAGRATAPDPDRRLLDSLPLARHLDLLREAGTVTFLEAAAGRGGPPLRLALRQGPEAARQDAAEFAAALDALRRLVRADTAARRAFVADLPVEERAELDRALRACAALSAAERKTLAAVAAALDDPARPELRAAAIDWHRWLATIRPEEREDVIGANTDKRLDWLDWHAARIEGRGRQPPPDRPPGTEGRFRRPPPPPRGGPEPPEGRRPPDGPPPFKPDGPPPREPRGSLD